VFEGRDHLRLGRQAREDRVASAAKLWSDDAGQETPCARPRVLNQGLNPMDSAGQGPEIVFDPLPGEAPSRLVSENVMSANIARTGVSDWHPVGFFLKSPCGEWLGGLTGYIWGGWLHVIFLWVSEALRGQRHGTRLIDFTTSAVTRYLVVLIIIRRGTQSCFYRNGSTEYRTVRVSVFERPFDRESASRSGIGCIS
jgi:hypothetical protein